MKRRFFAPEILSCLVAGGVMLVHPLIFDDFYFNINRFKHAFYLYAAGGCLLLHGTLCLWNHAPLLRRPSFAGGAMAAFLLLAGISCALSEWPGDAFTGQNGRLCGLLFLLAVGAMAYIASGARNAGRFAVIGLLLSGFLCACLSLANFFGFDPLGFTPRMKKTDLADFISTIGNLDFFGAFLCLMLPASAAVFARLPAPRTVKGDSAPRGASCAVFADASPVSAPLTRVIRVFSGLNLIVGSMACVAARPDCALFGILFSLLALLLSGANDRKRMDAGLSLLLLGLASLSLLCRAFPNHHFSLNRQNGAYLLRAPYLTAAVCAALGALSILPRKKHRISPERWTRIWALVLILILLAGAAAFVRFSFFDLETELDGPLRLLRFDDLWGSYRGGVWTRCLRLYAEAGLRVWLFGYGPDCLKTPLAERFGAEIAEYSHRSFNNAHNEILQYLLTHGALGLLSYLVLVFGAVCALKKRAARDAFSAAQLAGTLAYFVCSLVNINQPITTPLFFMLMTAGILARPRRESASAKAVF